ncbi:MAG TPA: polysaccharide deacetylase family protein [Burkholderiales bacterium]|nr:polysaccharide deacetylase family protein [Burkholderiales bacterium]
MGQAVKLSPYPRNGDVRRRMWRPGIALKISAGLHAGAIVGLIGRPQWWPEILACIVLNHFLLGLIGLWPRSRSLGSNMLRLPEAAARRREIALTFDDGPDPDITPKVLELLEARGARASFFVVGEKASAHPELIREIARRGHSIENHSLRHSSFFGFFGLRALTREIGSAQEIVAGLVGAAPSFFRSPMGIRSPLLDPVITKLGLRYVTWTRRGYDTVSNDPAAVLKRLERNLAAGDILLMHDRGPNVLKVLPALLERISAAGLKPVSLPMAMR